MFDDQKVNFARLGTDSLRRYCRYFNLVCLAVSLILWTWAYCTLANRHVFLINIFEFCVVNLGKLPLKLFQGTHDQHGSAAFFFTAGLFRTHIYKKQACCLQLFLSFINFLCIGLFCYRSLWMRYRWSLNSFERHTRDRELENSPRNTQSGIFKRLEACII